MSAFDSVVSLVPELSRASERTVSLLSGGLTNTSYRVVADDEEFVVRIGCDNASTLGIDRVAEQKAITLAEKAGITPELLLFTQPEGHLVTRYLSGVRGFSVEEFVEPKAVARVAALLRNVHGLGRVERRFNPYADIRRWVDLLQSRGVTLPDRLVPLLGLVEETERERSLTPAPELVLCHNDPYHLNFLDDGSLWLIDWEYSGMGDAMYDLAGIGYRLDSEGRDHLLRSYFGGVDTSTREHLEALVPVYICWNTVWSLVETDGGMAGFDYVNLAAEFLDWLPYRS
jgi:thiamine kinase-like enzyme